MPSCFSTDMCAKKIRPDTERGPHPAIMCRRITFWGSGGFARNVALIAGEAYVARTCCVFRRGRPGERDAVGWVTAPITGGLVGGLPRPRDAFCSSARFAADRARVSAIEVDFSKIAMGRSGLADRPLMSTPLTRLLGLILPSPLFTVLQFEDGKESREQDRGNYPCSMSAFACVHVFHSHM